jgi:type VI secretion system secreted protein Hcp
MGGRGFCSYPFIHSFFHSFKHQNYTGQGKPMRNHIRNTLCILIGVVGFHAMPAQAAVDMFLCLEGIHVETKDERHPDCSDVLAWSWGASQSGTTHMGSGGGAGRANIQDISLTKWVDSASVELLEKLTKGEHIPTAEFYTYRTSASCSGLCKSTYVKIEFEDLIVSSLSTGGSGGEDLFTENLTLNFKKYKYTYTKFKEDGTKEQDFCTQYDAAENVTSDC